MRFGSNETYHPMLGVPRKTETGDHRGTERTSGVHTRASVENSEPDHGK